MTFSGRPRLRAIRRLSTALLVVVVVSITFSLSGLHRSLEDTLGGRWLFQARGAVTAPDDVVIVAIHDGTGDELGLPRMPLRWPRDAYAGVVDHAARVGAAAIVLDIAFRGEPRAGDPALAASLRGAGNTVLFKHLRRDARRVSGTDLALSVETEDGPPALLAGAAAAVAPFTLPVDTSLVTRADLFRPGVAGAEASQPLIAMQLASRGARGALFPALVEAAPEVADELARANDEQVVARTLRRAFRERPRLAQQLIERLPTDQASASARWLRGWIRGLAHGDRVDINFYGPQRSIRTVPFEAVHAGRPDALAALRDRIVFVGFSQPAQTEQQDSHPTVYTDEFGNRLAGVEIAATVAGNLIEGRLLRGLTPLAETTALVLWCLALALAGAILPLRASLPVQFLAMGVLVVVALMLFEHYALRIPLASPLLVGWPLAFATGLAVRYGEARAREGQLAEALSQYLPPYAAREISRSLAPLHAQYSVVTGLCLMTDVRGFSAWAHDQSATRVHRELNTYYGRVIADVGREGGVVANLVGDAMLAIWTAPWIDEALAARAARSALAITAPDQTAPGECTCAALHGGAFSLGNLGAGDHFEFAPVGDIVNMTAHMEALNREIGTRILVSHEIARRLQGFVLRRVGTFPIKGAGPERLYELLGEASEVRLSELAEAFERALGMLEVRRRPADVASDFTAILERFPDDGPSRYYLARLEKQQNEPG